MVLPLERLSAGVAAYHPALGWQRALVTEAPVELPSVVVGGALLFRVLPCPLVPSK
jgi:hypothetical protein